MNRRAFTIIELMVTVFIISLLLTAAAAGVVRTRKTGRDGQRVRDVLAIAVAIDQSTSNAKGLAPSYPGNQSTNVMCADVLGTPASNLTNNINFGLFTNRAIPKDPLPEITAANCANYRNGYTYSNRFGSRANLARAASGQNYEYVLEVGLESDRPSDETTLTAGADATSTKRRQFLVLGRPCTAGTSGNCTLP